MESVVWVAVNGWQRRQHIKLLTDFNSRLLERIDEGVFATCVECGGQIAIERLMALPGVRTCIACARH